MVTKRSACVRACFTRNPMLMSTIVLVSWASLLMSGCASDGAPVSSLSSPSTPAPSSLTRESEVSVMAVLDRYMDALNALDIEGHVSTYHFPHYRHASGKIVVWQSAEEAMPILGMPQEARRAALRGALEPDWHRSDWTRRDIVQADAEKVHVATRFVRRREDGSAIKAFESLYVLTFESGRWAIKGRSSFAP